MPLPDNPYLWELLDDYNETYPDLYVDADGELSVSAAEQMLQACKDLLAERLTPVDIENTFGSLDALIVCCLAAYELDELRVLWETCAYSGGTEPDGYEVPIGATPTTLTARDRSFLEGLESWLVWFVTTKATDAQSDS